MLQLVSVRLPLTLVRMNARRATEVRQLQRLMQLGSLRLLFKLGEFDVDHLLCIMHELIVSEPGRTSAGETCSIFAYGLLKS